MVFQKNKLHITIGFIFIFFCSLSQSQYFPTSISGLSVWYVGDSCKKVTNSQAIDTLIDLSQNHNNCSQQYFSQKPIINNNKLNNHNTVSFDGLDDYLRFNDTISIQSVFSVFKYSGGNVAVEYPSILGCIDDPPKYISMMNNGTTFFRTSGEIFLTNYNINLVNTSDLSPMNNWKLSYGYSTSSATLNNVQFGASLAFYPSTCFKGDIAELIIFDRSLLQSEIEQIQQYLLNKYSPPITLPTDIISSGSICDTTIFPINPYNNEYSNYQWSTGATTPTISVNKSGKYWVNATNIFGKVSSDTIIVTYPKYEFKDSAFCQGNTIQWNTNLPKNQFSFLWQDGLTTDSVFNISQAGQYHVKIMDNFGCSIESDTITATIDDFKNTVSLGPDTSLCSGNAIYLKQGLQSNLTYTWNTGSYNDSLYISSSGQYSAIITNSNNCVAKDTINVTVVGQAPTAAFLNSVACKNNVVTFTDNSSPPVGNTITSWFWNYGDGTTLADTSHLQNPFYTYADTGNYTVNLIINTDVGCKQTLVKNVHVAPKPTVNFTNAIACKNDSALFSNSSSSINYTPLTYSWNFGDPVSGITNNSSTLTNPKHLFSQQTTYPVKLITTNNAGCKDSLTKNISVKAQVTASFTNNSPCTNAPIIFQDNSIAPAPNNQNIRIWTIGSSTLTGLNATKSFTNPGVYPVTLTVNGSNGCVSSITKQIDVKLPPFADLSLSTICLNDTSKPTNLSVPQSGPITFWNWQNNNSTFSTAQTPCLIPTNPGNYNIKLVVGSSDNCKDSMTKQLTVLPLPNVDFVTNPSTFYYINSPITFSPTINTGSLYKWSIDGNLYTAPVTSVSFNSTGTHSASLYMRDAVGCANNKTKIFTVSGYLLDLAVIDIRSHKGTDNFISVEADLANFGTVPISNFEISYQVADAGFIKETWIGNLNPSAFMTYSFNSKSFQKNNTTNFITCVNIGLVNSIPDDVLSNNNLCIAANINDITVNDPSPNPTDGDINLSIVLPKTSSIIIELIDALGQIVYPEYTIHGDAGLNLISIPTTGFNRGSYVLKITIGDKIFIKKVLKVKQ